MFANFSADPTLAEMLTQPWIKGASPRLRSFGLLSHQQKSSAVELLGVRPQQEEGVTSLPEHIEAGDYLKATDRNGALLGAGLTDATGTASFPIDAPSPGSDLLVRVTAHNHLPTDATTMVAAGSDGVILFPSPRMTACSRTLRSSRMLPGQAWARSRPSAAPVSCGDGRSWRADSSRATIT